MNARRLIVTCIAVFTALTVAAGESSSVTDPAARRDGVVSYTIPSYPPIMVNDAGDEITSTVVKDIARAKVVIRLRVASSGVVESLETPSGKSTLSRYAADAAKAWTFEPADQERTVAITFLFEGERQSKCDSYVDGRYESPFTLHLHLLLATTYCFPRVDGKPPEKECPLHHELMTVESVPVFYGLIDFDGPAEAQEYRAASAAKFPYSPHHMLGGCTLESKRFAEVFVCRICRRNEKWWLVDHPWYRP